MVTTAHIADVFCSFNYIFLLAPICPPNTWFLEPALQAAS